MGFCTKGGELEVKSALIMAVMGMFTVQNLLTVLLGTLAGMVFGALPGFQRLWELRC